MERDWTGEIPQTFWLLDQPSVDPFAAISDELRFVSTGQGQLVYTNPVFQDLFRRNLAVGEAKVDALFADPAQYRKLLSQVNEKGRFRDELVTLKLPNGNSLTAKLNGCLYPKGTGENYLLWSGFHITYLVRSLQELKVRNEELSHQMEKFLYSTSHDLRSPITSILGLVNLLKLETKDKTVGELAGKIELCTLKLDNLIRDIMTFSRATYQPLNSEKIEFEQLIWRIINSHFGDPHFSHIHFEVSVHEHFPFYNDPQRLSVIFENIVRNAIAFMDINKVKPCVRVLIRANEKEAVIEVMDNGIGISAQHIGSIFNMFYKASAQSRGAGLGLYIVKDCVTQLKGTIDAVSEIGFGSVFRLTIPNDTKGLLISRKLRLMHASDKN